MKVEYRDVRATDLPEVSPVVIPPPIRRSGY